MDPNLQAVQAVCRGNPEAVDFLLLWNSYVHQIDDIVDGARTDAQEILETFAVAVRLYSHPFYLQNLAGLRPVAELVTVDYALSVRWERTGADWQQAWADHHRHCGEMMVLVVALIVGGYPHARAVSEPLRANNYHLHHDAEGNPI